MTAQGYFDEQGLWFATTDLKALWPDRSGAPQHDSTLGVSQPLAPATPHASWTTASSPSAPSIAEVDPALQQALEAGEIFPVPLQLPGGRGAVGVPGPQRQRHLRASSVALRARVVHLGRSPSRTSAEDERSPMMTSTSRCSMAACWHCEAARRRRAHHPFCQADQATPGQKPPGGAHPGRIRRGQPPAGGASTWGRRVDRAASGCCSS
ncbi:MAG: hypothetical protein R3F43_11060 [bacterium]